MRDGRCAGDQQDIGRALKQPGECYLQRRSIENPGGCVEGRRLQRREASQRKERHIGYASTCKVVDKAIVMPVRHVVEVLYADNFGNRLRLGQLIAIDVAQTEMTDQSLTLQLRKHSERLFD